MSKYQVRVAGKVFIGDDIAALLRRAVEVKRRQGRQKETARTAASRQPSSAALEKTPGSATQVAEI